MICILISRSLKNPDEIQEWAVDKIKEWKLILHKQMCDKLLKPELSLWKTNEWDKSLARLIKKELDKNPVKI